MEQEMGAHGGKAGGGHPLPASDEARAGELPEHLVREKGRGGDARDAVQPAQDPVSPDGESYDIGRDQAARDEGRPAPGR
jgi:hypothetical protein